MERAYYGHDTPDTLLAEADRAVARFPFDAHLRALRHYMRQVATRGQVVVVQPVP